MYPLQALGKGFCLQIWKWACLPGLTAWFMSSTTRFPGHGQGRALDLACWNEDQLMNSHGTFSAGDPGTWGLGESQSRPERKGRSG